MNRWARGAQQPTGCPIIGKTIATARAKQPRPCSQADLASAIGMTRSMVAQIEVGNRGVSESKLKQIGDVLGVKFSGTVRRGYGKWSGGAFEYNVGAGEAFAADLQGSNITPVTPSRGQARVLK